MSVMICRKRPGETEVRMPPKLAAESVQVTSRCLYDMSSSKPSGLCKGKTTVLADRDYLPFLKFEIKVHRRSSRTVHEQFYA